MWCAARLLMRREAARMERKGERMINEINGILERIGSTFRTKDGLTICGAFGVRSGALTFLKRTFDSQEQLFEYVKGIEARRGPVAGGGAG